MSITDRIPSVRGVYVGIVGALVVAAFASGVVNIEIAIQLLQLLGEANC